MKRPGRRGDGEPDKRSARLLQSGKGNEATFWFYAGQLRWRSRLNADPDQDPTGEAALFSPLLKMTGPEVNGGAFGDTPELH